MTDESGTSQTRGSVAEIVGAWLGIWTPRRGTYIPPVPVFRIALGLAALVVAIVVSMHFVSQSKRHGDARERSEAAAATARDRARQAREPRPRHALFPGPATAGVPPARLAERRTRFEHALEAAITGDALRRYRARALHSRVLHTRCKPWVRPPRPDPPEPPLGAPTGKYECTAVTTVLPRTDRTSAGVAGYPFWARVDFRHGSATWCKINPRPAERGIGGDAFAPLVRACDLFRD